MADARDAPVPRGGNYWPLLARVAAAIILALNLWMAADNAARFQGLLPPAWAGNHPTNPFQTDAETKLADVARAPDAGPLATRLLGHEEDHEWDMP
jgi:hypothetical protein